MRSLLVRCVSLLLLVTWSMSTFAQAKKKITGTVRDKDGNPVVSATINEKGTSNNVVSATDGTFAIDVSTGATLVVSSVGFANQEIKIGNRNTFQVDLESSSGDLDEVVVTALGVKKERRSLGYATATVKGEELLKAGATNNPFLALYGKAAGVGVNISSSGPTGGINVRIRGAAGLESGTNTRPLFVVDGVPLYDEATNMENRGFDPLNSFDYGSGINDLNPEDIESMEILKGAKATVLYGSQALNGVVLVTTKSGRKTRGLGIQFSQQVSVEKPFTFIDFQNEYGTGDNQRLTGAVDSTILNGTRVRKLRSSRYSFGPKFDGSPIMFYDSTMTTYSAHPDNFLDFFRSPINTRTNIAISGGGEFGSIRAAYSRNDYNDILPGFNQRENKFSFNGSFKVSPFATFEFINNLYSVKTRNRRPNINQLVSFGVSRDADFNWIKDFYRDSEGFRRDLEPYGLPPWARNLADILWEQNDNRNTDSKLHLISSIRATLQFTKRFSFVGQASVDYTNTDFVTENKIIRLSPARIGGAYRWDKRNTTVQNYQGLLKYDQTFGEDWDLFVVGGGAFQRISDNLIYASTGDAGLLYPDWFSLNNENLAGWANADSRGKVRGLRRGSNLLYSAIGSATLSYKSTYYLELQARNDWNSTLEAPNYSYFYPGASLTWNFDQNIQIPQLQTGKLRFGFADVGGGPLSNERYFANDAFSVGQIPYPNNPPTVVSPPNSLFLEKIKPFRKREYEIGFDTRWFPRNRLEFNFSFYTNNTYNQIIALPITAASGYNNVKINSGNVKNWGYEIFIKALPVVTPKYRWDVTFTAARERSKTIKIYDGITSKFVDGNTGFQVWAEEGKRLGEIRAFDYRRDPDGNRIVNSGGAYTLTDKVVNSGKNVNPDVYGGLYSDFFFKGFNFHVGFDYKFGGTIFSFSNNYLMGNGVIEATLPYRDEAHGGLAYYVDNTTGRTVAWQHNQPAPANARDGIVYHNGMVLSGVKEITTGGTTKYEPNDIILSSTSYYQSYINDLATSWPPDRLFKNDYIKIREIAIDYTIPRRITDRVKLQKVTLTAAVRNLGYIYKTLPNIDTEAALGAQGYIEYSFYPAIRSFNFGLNVSF